MRGAIVLAAYLLLTLVLTWPLARDLGHAVPVAGDPVDPLLQTYLLGWGQRALLTAPLRIFDPPQFHPEPRTLTYMDPLIGEAAASLPVRAAGGGLPAAYNVLVGCSFVASAWATYRWARALGISRAGAFLAGALFAFGPYRLSNLGNLNQLQTQFLPLGLYFTTRALKGGGAIHLWGAAATLAVQGWFGWYGTLHLAVAQAAMVALGARGAGWRWTPRFRFAALGAAATALVALLPVAWPYLERHRALPEFRRTLGQAALYSADLLDYLRALPESPLGLFLPRSATQPYWVGWVAALLAGVALAARARRGAGAGTRGLSTEGTLAGLGLAGFVLSLGPALQVAGRRLPVPLPFALLFVLVPGFAAMRAPGRFAVLVLLAAAALAGRGFDALRSRLEAGVASAAARRARACALLAAALSIAVVEAFVAPIPMLEVAGAPAPVYAWLARERPDGALLELPMPAREADESERDARRQLESLAHGWPRADGVSGFSSRSHERFRRVSQEFPAPAALAAARSRGVTRVLVRYAEVDPARRAGLSARVRETPGLVEIARFGDDAVYALRAGDPVPGAVTAPGAAPPGE